MGVLGVRILGEDLSLEVERIFKQGANKRKRVHGPSWDPSPEKAWGLGSHPGNGGDAGEQQVGPG